MKAHRLMNAALLVSGLGVLAACADLEWRNPTVPETQWAADRQRCNAAAYGEARQLYDDPFVTRDTHRPGIDGDLARMRLNDLRERQRRHTQAAFERCMADKGYERMAVTSPGR
jgi:hypothetical protein